MKTANSMPGILLAGFLLITAAAGAQTPLYFGWSGVLLHTADYDDDGRGDMGLYDAGTGAIYARNINGTELAFGDTIGLPGFIPACADFDGDRKADPALYDSASGAWIILPSMSGYQPYSFTLGGNGATAVPADYDGDQKTDSCV